MQKFLLAFGIGTFLGFSIVTIGVGSNRAYARQHDVALVKVGEIYQVAWTCLPQLGCYAEALKIETIRPDGWTDVFQCQEPSCKEGERWTVNLQNAYAIRPFPPVGKAAN